MPLATLQTVDPGHRKFTTKFGEMAAFDVSFTDGRSGQVVTKIETLQRRQSEYQDLIGKEIEYILEDNGTWPDGSAKPLKVKRPFGPGGPDGRPSARPPRDEHFIQERMDRRTALMQAVALVREPVKTDTGMSVVMGDANKFYDWLRKTAGGEVHGEGASPSATTSEGGGSQGTPSPSEAHVHHYERIPNVTKYLRCVCGATEKV
jgi:hypothetical protein